MFLLCVNMLIDVFRYQWVWGDTWFVWPWNLYKQRRQLYLCLSTWSHDDAIRERLYGYAFVYIIIGICIIFHKYYHILIISLIGLLYHVQKYLTCTTAASWDGEKGTSIILFNAYKCYTVTVCSNWFNNRINPLRCLKNNDNFTHWRHYFVDPVSVVFVSKIKLRICFKKVCFLHAERLVIVFVYGWLLCWLFCSSQTWGSQTVT